jgi:hypothetical protein
VDAVGEGGPASYGPPLLRHRCVNQRQRRGRQEPKPQQHHLAAAALCESRPEEAPDLTLELYCSTILYATHVPASRRP